MLRHAPLLRRLLLATAVAASLCLSRADIRVEDGFLDEATRADLLAQLPVQSRFKDSLKLPTSLYDRLRFAIDPAGAATTTAEATHSTEVPTKGERRFVPSHKDTFQDDTLVDGQVGLVYLEGNGCMTFTHDVTGEQTVVDVKPGRFLSWDNAQYRHKLEAGSIPRRILGPMALRDGLMQSIGDLPESILAQAYVSPLVVKAGGIVAVTLDMVVLEWPTPDDGIDDGRRGRKLADQFPPNITELVASCSFIVEVGAANFKNKTDKFADEEELTFKHSTLRQNTWKPKLKYDNDGDELTWTLPEEGLVLEKQYKITWKVRVGRNVESGTELPLLVAIEDLWAEELVVTVK